MPRITIEQFRARLAGRADESPAARAYREQARRPELTAGMAAVEWVPWPPVAASASAAA